MSVSTEYTVSVMKEGTNGNGVSKSRDSGGVSFYEHDFASSRTAKFLSTAIRTVLEDALEQFYILRTLNNRNAMVFEERAVQYKNVDDRFTGTENHAATRLPSVGTNYDKIARDINTLISILRETSLEVKGNNNYTILQQCIAAMHGMKNDDKILLDSRTKNSIEIKRLKKQLADERKSGICTIEKTYKQIQDLKFTLEDVIVYARYENGYFIKWEATRREQNEESCKEKEEFYRNTVKDTKEKIELERKCHAQFDGYIEESKNDMIDEINYWVKRYDEELENREAEMIEMRGKLERLTAERLAIVEKNEKRQAKMAEWKEYKKQREIRKKRAKVERWASMIIQAWWRGIMVRKRLGPYKKRKGKAKGKK